MDSALLKSIPIHLANFLILYLIMWVLLYKPVAGFMRKRKEKYESELAEISEREKKVAELEGQSQNLLDVAREDARKYSDAETAAARTRAEAIIAEANSQAQEILQRAHKGVDEEQRAAMEQVKQEAAELAMQIAHKILAREVKPEDNRALIERFLQGGEGA